MLDRYRYSAGQFIHSFFVYRLTGDDVGYFLQAQSTYNFKSLKENEYHLISFLDSSAKVDFYCWALKTSSEVLLLTPLKLAEQAQIRLEKFLISEDVTIYNFAMVVIGRNTVISRGVFFFWKTTSVRPFTFLLCYPLSP